ncbi:DUF983 domain-containing protein [Tsuneonella flava]|uniref:DUF983 domain-containing protein n=1 Tax=Tsuneonella flava TaxID=2055955 RepID=A0ABX7K9G5_9SPHN|nr:DUF983 domain-containing protein [Tsuneonella flava]QSB44629.1 DUF983 domain-containing protein [Tsuneonella flava]
MTPTDSTAIDHAHPTELPASYWQAARRGASGHCPRCGGGELFRKWLKPVDRCRACGQDWTHARADDIPAYIAIFATGHLLAPLMIMLILDFDMSSWAASAIIIPLATAMVLLGLQPSKGAVIALQWWLGMLGFQRERPETNPLPDRK